MHTVMFSTTEVGVIVLLSLIILKFVDRWIDGKNKNAMMTVIKEEADFFKPNVERTRKIEAKVIDIQGHMVGNNEILREISKTNLINAGTQKQITHLLERHDDAKRMRYLFLGSRID